MSFQVDLQDVLFALEEHLKVERLLGAERYKELSMDDFRLLLEEGRKMAVEVLAPTNVPGDRHGARFEGGKVTLPHEMVEAYKKYVDAGWIGMGFDAAIGGTPIPHVLGFPLTEMFVSANTSFNMYPGLSRGVASLLLGVRQRATAQDGASPVDRRMVGHDVSDRAAGGLGAGRSDRRSGSRGRPLPDPRHENLHQCRGARSDREHLAPGAGAAAGRARGDEGHQPLSGSEVPHRRERQPRRGQRRRVRRHRREDGHQGQRHLRAEVRRGGPVSGAPDLAN